jgi:AmmeMemoRadiSam system protein B
VISKAKVRLPRFADNKWYPALADDLHAALDEYLAVQPVDFLPQHIIGLLAPHAGHRFSGHVAGAAFAHLHTGKFDIVVLLGPDHRGAAPGRLSTPAVNLWRTPLGDVPVAWELLDEVHRQIPLVFLNDDQEHALEIELPFIQKTLDRFRLLPLIMGEQSFQSAQQLSAVLAQVIHQAKLRPLFVASSDLSHFFDDATARKLDEKTLQFLKEQNPRGFANHIAAGKMHGQPLACGAGPIITVMQTSQAFGATQTRLLKYATSADAAIYPDSGRVVGYAAAAFTC